MRILIPLLFATFQLPAQTPSKSTPYPDCILSLQFTGTGTQVIPESQNPIACSTWNFSYYSTGFSALSIVVQTAPDISGSPGSWSTFTANSPYSNPNTAITSAYATFGPAAFPWVRVSITSVTGTGKITGFLYGWKTSASGSNGSATGPTYTLVQHPINAACPALATCNLTAAATTAGNLLVFVGVAHSSGASLTYQTATGDAFTHCPFSNANFDLLAVDCAYVLSAAGGATSFSYTWNHPPSAGAPSTVELLEFNRTSGVWAYDGSNSSTTECLSCLAPTPLPDVTGNDVVVQMISANNSPATISGCYSSPTDVSTSVGVAACLGVTSYAAPSWTMLGGFLTSQVAMGIVTFQ